MITYWPATAGAQLDAATMRSCTLLLALAAADATRWLGGAIRGGSTLTSRKLFATEELEHPFSALAAFLCEAPELGEKGPKRVRRALLALSTSTKTVKFVDGATHHAIKMGASAASGATVAERVAAARDVAGRGPRALKKRASAACRARMALEALEACELCRRAPEGDIVETSRGACEVCVVEEDARCVISIHWRSGATKLVTALDADACDIVTPDFQRARASAALLELAEDVVDSLQKTLSSLKNGTEVVLVGHGGGGAVAALAASLLSGVVRRPPTPPKKPQQQLGDLNLAQKREPPRPPPFRSACSQRTPTCWAAGGTPPTGTVPNWWGLSGASSDAGPDTVAIVNTTVAEAVLGQRVGMFGLRVPAAAWRAGVRVHFFLEQGCDRRPILVGHWCDTAQVQRRHERQADRARRAALLGGRGGVVRVALDPSALLARRARAARCEPDAKWAAAGGGAVGLGAPRTFAQRPRDVCRLRVQDRPS